MRVSVGGIGITMLWSASLSGSAAIGFTFLSRLDLVPMVGQSGNRSIVGWPLLAMAGSICPCNPSTFLPMTNNVVGDGCPE